MVTLYGLKNCSTCKKALQWMDDNQVKHTFIDYRESPLTPAQLSTYAEHLGWPKLVNRASMTWRRLSDREKDPQSDTDWLKLIEQHPALIRRPLAVAGDEVRTGFKPDQWADWLESAKH